MDRGYYALRDGGPLRTTARAPLPCCSLTAAWALAVTGSEPTGRSLNDWARLDPDFWRYANIARAESYVWDSLWAIQAKLEANGIGSHVSGGWLSRTDAELPPLTLGRWHVVQRWRGSIARYEDGRITGSPPAGHAQLWRAFDGGTAECVQSSVDKGYRRDMGRFSGLAGYSVAVLTLDALP